MTWRPALALAVLISALIAVSISLAAAPAVTPPTITAQPAAPTNATSAHFTYADTQSGVSYQCQLDGAEYVACPATGVTYAGPLAAGSHTFKVQALAGTKTSAATTYKWTVDTTAPTVSLTFPDAGDLYGAAGWGEGCTSAGFCGKAKDARGVTSVLVSIQQGNGKWWGGSSFNKASETLNAASVESPAASTTGWSYQLAVPADGPYTVHVRASDEAGNTSSPTNTTFTIDTTAPPAPTITSAPEEETGLKSATFAFSDGEAGVSYVCAKDEKTLAPCTSPKLYPTVSQGEHVFYLAARDAAGNLSATVSYAWTVVKAFTITGNLSGALAPGVSRALQLTISNPNTKALQVTNLLVAVQAGSTKAGCDGPTNLQVTQSNASETNALTVPAKGKVSIPTGTVSAPQVLMRNLASNQDACKGATFTFNYDGNGHS